MLFPPSRKRSISLARIQGTDHMAEIIASRPNIAQELPSISLVEFSQFVTQELQGFTQWLSPSLGPPIFSSATATATVFLPTSDTVSAAPRRVLDNLQFPIGDMSGQDLAVNSHFELGVSLPHFDSPSQRHLTIAMVMAIGLAIRSNRYIVGFKSSFRNLIRKILTIVKVTRKSHSVGKVTIIHENRKGFSGWKHDFKRPV